MLRSVKTISLALLCLFVFVIESNGQMERMGMPQISKREERAIRNIKAREVLKYMDLSVDPCKDFYDFACGNWGKYHELPNDGTTITTQSQIEHSVIKDLKVILEEQSQEGRSVHKIKQFFKSCLTVDNSSPSQKSFMINFIKRYGGLQALPETNWHMSYNWVRTIAALRVHYGLEILIGIDLDINLETMRGKSIYLGEPGSTIIPAEQCSSTATEEVDVRDEVYESIQRDVASNMQMWLDLPEGEAIRIAGDIVRFEFELCKQMRKEQVIQSEEDGENEVGNVQPNIPYRTGQSRLHGKRTNIPFPRRSLIDLTKLFNGVIDFKQFVDISFDSSINDLVYVRSENYLRHLAQTIRTNPKPTVANYIMYRALSYINFPYDDRPTRRSKYCIELILHYFPKQIGELYGRKFHKGESKIDAEVLYSEISKALEESFKVDWMDENTRRAARQKLSQFKIRFPVYQNLEINELPIENLDYWHKLELIMKYHAKEQLDRYSYETVVRPNSVEAPDVRVQMMPIDSEIMIGWGLLQRPFYHFLYPNSIKYSLLGQRIARELMTAFDEQGWNQNPLSPLRWDDYIKETYDSISECFRTQYSNYLYNNPDDFRNATKLREIISDSSGLNVAFNAYLAWLDATDPINRMTLLKETLPDVNFSNTQLFFINFAQTRCSARYEEEPPPEFLPMDKHTPERYYVNGPLGNNAEFAREFGCVPGTEMNPGDKCVVY